MKISQAVKGKVIASSNFGGYDICFNPYVGCQFGCAYCYVRFFVKDSVPWGEWVRSRDHSVAAIGKELPKYAGKRLVIGTMTDPYQPCEAKLKLTQKCLEEILKFNLNKVGIFTRSPLVKRDIELISKLPRGRVHFTIPPLPPSVLKILEPIGTPIHARFKAVEDLKKAGIRVHVSVAPAIPGYSDPFTKEYAAVLAQLKVDEFFVDPMQAYKQPLDEVSARLGGSSDWAVASSTMTDRVKYKAWKAKYQYDWMRAWFDVAALSPKTKAISSDHESKTKIDMTTGEKINWETYDAYEGDGK